jgi:hypothetical protein
MKWTPVMFETDLKICAAMVLVLAGAAFLGRTTVQFCAWAERPIVIAADTPSPALLPIPQVKP